MPGHLLVIDDSPTVLKVIELALGEAGYTVTARPTTTRGWPWCERRLPFPTSSFSTP